jgi:hypothetical protein
LKVALVKQVLDVFGPWSGVLWRNTSPTKLFDVWPGKAVYWELTCLLQADWYIVPVAVEGEYLQDAVRKHPGRAELIQKNTKNITPVEDIPFADYDLTISFDAILDIPPGQPGVFAYYAQEHWDVLYENSRKRPAPGYDLFLAHMLDAPDDLKSLPQSISMPYLHNPDLVRSLFTPHRREAAWVDWRTPMTLGNKGLGDAWCAEADRALIRLSEILEMEVHCRTVSLSKTYAIADTPTWGDAAHYYRELAECRYYIAVGSIAGAGQALADAASVGCICIGQADKPYHRLLCHPHCLCEDMAQMPAKLRAVRQNADLHREVLSCQDQNLRKHFRDVPLALLSRAIELKRES